MRSRLREHPLAVLLPVQALLYFWHLTLLSPWFDEADQLRFLHSTLANSINIPASGGHPPLYFLIVYAWMRLPLGLSWTVQARTLSVLFALGATVAADRLWARQIPYRIAFLLLWVLSPFLLLYSRMSRSYSAQLLAATCAAGLLIRYLEKPAARTRVWLALWLTVAMYIHYIPGGALLAAANVALLLRRCWRDAVFLDAVVSIAQIPVVLRLLTFLPQWRAHQSYALTGHFLSETVVKLAYWAMSFVMGEAVPDPVLLAGGLVLIGVAVLLISGVRRRRELAIVAAVAAAVGFLGVTRWVSYPFVPARMIFVFPMFLFLVVSGAGAWKKIGPAVLTAMLLLSISGIWCYFHRIDFRNKQYPMPMDEIAAFIAVHSTPQDSAVLVDSTNSDPIGLQLALGDSRTVLETKDPQAPAAIAKRLADPQIRTIWFLRNTHDVSPEQWNTRFEKQLKSGMTESVMPYEPFTPLEKAAMQGMGIPKPPDYFSELLEFSRR